MSIFRFPFSAQQIPKQDADLAKALRRLANEVERGEVGQLLITQIRPNGDVERLGNVLGQAVSQKASDQP